MVKIIHEFPSLTIQSSIKVMTHLPSFNITPMKEEFPTSKKEAPKRFMVELIQVTSHEEKNKNYKNKLFTNHTKTKI